MRRTDVNSTKGLDYHQQLSLKARAGNVTGAALVFRPVRPRSAAGSPAPSPLHALPPPQPLSCPSALPHARRPRVTPPHRAHIACARRRRVHGEALDYEQAPGGYRCPLFELHTPAYANLPVPMFCPCRLRARVRSRCASARHRVEPSIG